MILASLNRPVKTALAFRFVPPPPKRITLEHPKLNLTMPKLDRPSTPLRRE